jgi:hypothetical protein
MPSRVCAHMWAQIGTLVLGVGWRNSQKIKKSYGALWSEWSAKKKSEVR